MARKAGHGATGDKIRYVPEAFSNRDAPAEDQVIVYYRSPTESDKRAIASFGERQEVERVGDDVSVKIEHGATLTRLEFACARHVVEVENYVDENDQPIEDGKAFAKHGETPFIIEVGSLILGRLDTAELEKKAPESQSSCSLGIRALSGGVTSAEDKG